MRKRTLGALFAVSMTAFATLVSPTLARAEMVYRIATMGEPKTLDPHGVIGRLGKLCRWRPVHGTADGRR